MPSALRPLVGLPRQLQRAVGGRQDAAEDRQQRGLAAARGTHQQGQLAGHQVDVDALEGHHGRRRRSGYTLVMSRASSMVIPECVMVVVSSRVWTVSG